MNLDIFKKSLERKFLHYAKQDKKTIALPEAEFSGLIIKAAEYTVKKGIANIVLIGDEQKIKNTFLKANFAGMTFFDPKQYDRTNELAKKLYEIRKPKGLLLKEAKELILNPIYFATMLLEEGMVDGVVGGAATATADMLRPALQIIKTEEGIKTASSSFIVLNKKKLKIGDKGVIVLGDCALNVNPTQEELSDIAIATIKTAKGLAQLEPRVAMLSYSTNASGSGEPAEKVREATKLLKQRVPEIVVEGEIQADAALVKSVARVKVKNNNWKGDANVLIFPDLNSGNIASKLMKIAGKMKAIGPIMQGLNKPVNDLSRGASLKEIVLTIAITSLQAANLSEQERLERMEQEKLEKKLAKQEAKEQKRLERLAKKQAKKEAELLEEETEELVEKVEEVEEVEDKKADTNDKKDE
jgi:phosphate acetyltransferase